MTQNAINTGKPIEVANGGTGAATFTANSLLLGNGTSAVSALGAATNGQLPIGSTAASPVLAALTQGTNVTVTNGAGSITVAAANQVVLIQSQNASNSASISFTTGITNTYNCYMFEISNLLPVNDNTNLQMQVSVDGGANYIATGYQSGITSYPYNSTTATNTNSTTLVLVMPAVSNAAPASSATLYGYNITNGSRAGFSGQTSFNKTGNVTNFGLIVSTGSSSAVTINAFQFTMSAGNISTGTFSLYGIKET